MGGGGEAHGAFVVGWALMPAKYKRCVAKVAPKKGVRSAHAICTAADAGGIKGYRKKEAARRKKR